MGAPTIPELKLTSKIPASEKPASRTGLYREFTIDVGRLSPTIALGDAMPVLLKD
jgi:hypothetical protein